MANGNTSRPPTNFTAQQEDWLALLDEPRSTLLVATRRLGRDLLERYARCQREAGRSAWPTPRVLVWDEFLGERWRRHAVAESEAGRFVASLISASQERVIWESVIASHVRNSDAAGLLPLAATARAAQDAWWTMHEWRLSAEELECNVDADAAMFARWADDVGSRMRAARWISIGQVGGLLLQVLQPGRWREQGKVVLAGFDQLSPLRDALLARVAACGAAVEHIPSAGPAKVAARVACADPREELEAAARWARGLLSSGQAISVGILVPDLAARRGEVVSALQRVLAHEPVEAAPGAGVFHVSLGKPLADYPLVHDALSLLRAMTEPPSLMAASRLIQSPYVGGADSELPGRSRLDRRLRQFGLDRLGLPQLLRMARQGSDISRLVAMLERILELLSTWAAAGGPVVWAERFAAALRSWGWPGDGALTSGEQQTVATWQEVLSEFAALGAVLETLTAEEAIQRLTGMSRERVFQPQAAGAPVQVMGLQEAAGLYFSHAWILGMSDDCWPPQPSPVPFLPVHSQRRAGIPASSPEGQLESSRRVTARLLASANHLIVSHPATVGDQILRWSPLFADLPVGSVDQIELDAFQSCAAWLYQRRPDLEYIDDARGPALESPAPVAGGVAVLRDQSACPFRAFTHHRLQAIALPDVGPGYSAADRGSWVHACLAEIWRELGDSNALRALSDDDLRDAVLRHVAAVMGGGARGDDFRGRLIELERERTVAALLEWLAVERKRPAFEVLAVEEDRGGTFGGLSLKMTVDRIDRLPGGGLFLIDYKTGARTSVDAWLDDRPEEPQLPAYFLVVDGASALSFAQVRKGDSRFAGLARDAGAVPGLLTGEQLEKRFAPGWEGLRAHWLRTLDILGEQFRAGCAEVDPKGPRSCEYCDVEPLCRIFEAESQGREDGGSH